MLALLPLLLASTTIDPGAGVKLLGWTADGQDVVWTSTDTASSFPKQYFLMKGDEQVPVADPSKLSAADRANVQEIDPAQMMGATPQLDEQVTLATVHDARRGSDLQFVLAYKALSADGKKTATLKKKYAALGDAAAFATWKTQHPLALKAGKTGAHGTLAITVKPSEPLADGETFDAATWKRDTLSWSVPSQVSVAISTTCGKDSASETVAQDVGAMYTPSWSATPYWDPSGHRVLVTLVEGIAKTMRGPDGGHVQYVILPCGPRVQVVAPAGLDALTGPIADAAEHAGFTVVGIDPAQAHRAATVIYADAAHADVAATLVTALPGGGSVDKLTWKPKAEVVIAIGDPAK